MSALGAAVHRAAAHDNRMVPRKRKKPLDAYKRIRKPVAPPARVVPDRRRKQLDEQARREADEERDR